MGATIVCDVIVCHIRKARKPYSALCLPALPKWHSRGVFALEAGQPKLTPERRLHQRAQ